MSGEACDFALVSWQRERRETVRDPGAEKSIVNAAARINEERRQSDKSLLLEDRDCPEPGAVGSQVAPPGQLPAG
jgi:hypothetical protein